MNNVISEINLTSDYVREFLSKTIENQDDDLKKLFDAIQYSCLPGGKMLRPFLTIKCSEMLSVDPIYSLRVAAAIELIHVFSLIHDDLPALDDDDMRRGKYSCHKKFDEATAILAGDALITMAFGLIADERTHHNSEIRCNIISLLAKATGPHGMIGGQILDMSNDLKLNENNIIKLQKMKTGALFSFSCQAACILGSANVDEKNALLEFSNNFGLAFQIIDDLIDFQENPKQDEGKSTFIELIGFDESKNKAKHLTKQAIQSLETFNYTKSESLRNLTEYYYLKFEERLNVYN